MNGWEDAFYITLWSLIIFLLLAGAAMVGLHLGQRNDLPGLGDWLAPRDELTVQNGG